MAAAGPAHLYFARVPSVQVARPKDVRFLLLIAAVSIIIIIRVYKNNS